ncbi:unnamed protein product, partial [marine sediment metagenome]
MKSELNIKNLEAYYEGEVVPSGNGAVIKSL